jgi:hypothetical protein
MTYEFDRVPTPDIKALHNLVDKVISELFITAKQSGDNLNTSVLVHGNLLEIRSALFVELSRREQVEREGLLGEQVEL